MNIALPALTFPRWEGDELYHVGTMDIKQKGKFHSHSLEGAGLSITTEPDAWRKITVLQGSLWLLQKQNNHFINRHDINDQQEKAIINWGIENGYVKPAQIFRVTSWGEEGEEYYSHYPTEKEAQVEAGDDDFPIEKIDDIKGTQKLAQMTGNPDAMQPFDLLLTVFAQSSNYDGVWWEDELDVYAYSAPRGVIAPNKLNTWKITRIGD